MDHNKNGWSRLMRVTGRKGPKAPKYLTARPMGASQRAQLRVAQEQAIHRSFYRTGGIRFWAECMEIYVRDRLDEEMDIEALWAGSYHSCIAMMRRELEKLERELEELSSRWGGWTVVPDNNDLLLCMRRVLAKERLEPMAEFEDRDMEQLRRQIRVYADYMEREMLSVYPRNE